jgi:hypothetical protein
LFNSHKTYCFENKNEKERNALKYLHLRREF